MIFKRIPRTAPTPHPTPPPSLRLAIFDELQMLDRGSMVNFIMLCLTTQPPTLTTQQVATSHSVARQNDKHTTFSYRKEC